MVEYLSRIDQILEQKNSDMDYEILRKEHLIQIEFFMHERLIHLLVTLVFAILTFATFFVLFFEFSIGLFLLFLALLVLLVPYILHYYRLENGVQKMYIQYDEMVRRIPR